MNILLEKDAATPLYQQLIEQVEQWVSGGDLPPGAPLPSIRKLARDLGIGEVTVRQAYDELIARGVLASRRGSGTFVADRPGQAAFLPGAGREEQVAVQEQPPPMVWEPYKYDSGFFGLPRQRGGKVAIDLARAQPDPGLFPFERIKAVVRDMLWEPRELFFDRGHAQGYQPLVEWLERQMALAGVDMQPFHNEIILTGGFQRGLSLTLDLLRAQTDAVAIEEPAYASIINLLRAKGIRWHTVPVDNAGMDTEYLAQLLKKERIKVIITVPAYHNPTGAVLSNERRQHLINLAVVHRVPIIEDDWGSPLRYCGTAIPPLKALDPGGYVIHMGSFSKTFLPGLRIGWITVPGDIAVTMLRAKLAADKGDSWFLQVLLHEFISRGYYDKHLRKSLKAYRARRRAMLDALGAQMPGGVSWQEPAGGLSVWLRLPRGLDSLPLLLRCREAGLDFAPAPLFSPQRADAPQLRLSFSRASEEQIRRGVEILGREIIAMLAQGARPEGEPPSYRQLIEE